MFSGILSSFISAVFIFVTTLYTMLVLDYRLTALVLLFLPLIFLLVNLYRKKSVKVIEKTRSLLSDINSKLAEKYRKEFVLFKPLTKKNACKKSLMR